MTLDPTQLAALMHVKHECLTLLRVLGLRQRELIDAGEMTRLLELLAEKQRTIHTLQQTEQALDPFRQEDPAGRAWPSEAQRLHCAGLVSRCDALLAEVLECERLCEEMLRGRRDETARQLSDVQTVGAVHGAYTASNVSTASTLDLSVDY
ncbi:MAG: hypothetical protein QM775_00015 [Pirellulales bacterium]